MKKYKITDLNNKILKESSGLDSSIFTQKEINCFDTLIRFKTKSFVDFVNRIIYYIEEEEAKSVKTIEKVLAAKEKMEEARKSLDEACKEHDSAVKEFLNEKGITGEETEAKEYIHADMIIRVHAQLHAQSNHFGCRHAIIFYKGELA